MTGPYSQSPFLLMTSSLSSLCVLMLLPFLRARQALKRSCKTRRRSKKGSKRIQMYWSVVWAYEWRSKIEEWVPSRRIIQDKIVRRFKPIRTNQYSNQFRSSLIELKKSEKIFDLLILNAHPRAASNCYEFIRKSYQIWPFLGSSIPQTNHLRKYISTVFCIA